MIKIFSLRKEEHHSHYILEKKQEFFMEFRKFLVDMGFGEEHSNIEIYGFGRPNDEDGEPQQDKEEDIAAYSDRYYLFRNEEYTIDIVFGKDRIFLIISSKHDKSHEINKKINKFCSF